MRTFWIRWVTVSLLKHRCPLILQNFLSSQDLLELCQAKPGRLKFLPQLQKLSRNPKLAKEVGERRIPACPSGPSLSPFCDILTSRGWKSGLKRPESRLAPGRGFQVSEGSAALEQDVRKAEGVAPNLLPRQYSRYLSYPSRVSSWRNSRVVSGSL